MAEFTLSPFITMPLFIKLTQNSLGIDAKGHFLDLDGFEEFGGFAGGGVGGCFFFFALQFFGFFAFGFGAFG